MDSTLSDSTLGISKKVLAILAAIDGKPYSMDTCQTQKWLQSEAVLWC